MTDEARFDAAVRSPGSRLLHLIDHVTSRPLVAWSLVTADVCWIILSIVWDFPGHLELIFQTIVAAATVAMVFVIQHTQAREQIVVQRKLDEILHALPRANQKVIGLEDASDAAIAAVHADQRQMHPEVLHTNSGR